MDDILNNDTHTILNQNAISLERELDWLSNVITARIQLYFGHECDFQDIYDISPPDLSQDLSLFAETVREYSISFDERLLLILALAPHIRPQILDPFLIKNTLYDRGFTEFGGMLPVGYSGFWPTLETALFLLAGDDLSKRFSLQSLFDHEHFLSVHKIISLEGDASAQEANLLKLGQEYLNRFTLGTHYRPGFSASFPAQRITTALEWDDLVLSGQILDEVEEIKAWIKHRHTLLQDWQLAKKIKPGFRCLFYGPPGTGKTLTASLLGKTTGLDVYRIDLSLVVSKFIGETEKNLSNIFDQAQAHDWILFFDEADALFGKRTQTTSAHDRYANQEVSYLLQRVEDFPGVVILATNLKGNIDEAFARRFQSMIYFPMPGSEERLRLWSAAFSTRCQLEDGFDLARVADDYEVAGGAIINVTRFASLMALRRGNNVIRAQDVRHGIRRELRKEGKLV